MSGRRKQKTLSRSAQKNEEEAVEAAALTAQLTDLQADNLERFCDLPLSSRTLRGLTASGFTSLTEVQRQTIPSTLRGEDLLAAAKTGSGKTLAFVIPLLEKLWHLRWSRLDGLGVLVITPTRELALQIFEVVRKVGQYHDFSAGLVIGGKLVREEAQLIGSTNIVICTPGRLQQHLEETYSFRTDSLQLLVLDEADRILDSGFQAQVDEILSQLPPRQTLLFSATQTKKVSDLARLSLSNPVYVSVHGSSAEATPVQLSQSFVICEPHEKLSLLWSFVKTHLHQKILVFLATCKQVRFVYEVFRHLRPGMTVLHLHGGLQQLRRIAVYEEFARKQNVLLLATDIAARGLDFPSVNWVIQVDCPEDAQTYIHRAGRTARNTREGQSLLLLTPDEKTAMLEQLREAKVSMKEIKLNPHKQMNLNKKTEALCAEKQDLKDLAQRAVVAYLKSCHLQRNKAVFDVSKVEPASLATSFGLIIPPKIRFLKKTATSKIPDEKSAAKVKVTKQKRPFEKSPRLPDVFSAEQDEDDELFVVKKSESVAETVAAVPLPSTRSRPLSKISEAKRALKKGIALNQRLQFDESGEAVRDPHRDSALGGDFTVEGALDFMKQEDYKDKKLFRDKVRKRHREERLAAKEERRAAAEQRQPTAVLGDYSDEDDLDESRGVVGDSGSEVDSPPEPAPSKKKRKVARSTAHLAADLDDEELALRLLSQ